MDSKFVGKARKTAEANFASGLYCAESVALALAKAQGIESDLLPRVATGFCSGMARSCGPCGALTGAVMGVGLALGRRDGDAPVADCYMPTRQLIQEFEQTFGARNCHELLGCDLGTPEGQAAFRQGQLHERCVRYTGEAAEIAARLLAPHLLKVVPVTAAEAMPLLAECDLQTADLAAQTATQTFGIHLGGALAAVVGLELYPPYGLLRSLAVRPGWRDRGFAHALVAFAEAHAKERGVESLFLLTKSAEPFFLALGYRPAARETAPPAIRATQQFSSLCPASAALLSKSVAGHS